MPNDNDSRSAKVTSCGITSIAMIGCLIYSVFWSTQDTADACGVGPFRTFLTTTFWADIGMIVLLFIGSVFIFTGTVLGKDTMISVSTACLIFGSIVFFFCLLGFATNAWIKVPEATFFKKQFTHWTHDCPEGMDQENIPFLEVYTKIFSGFLLAIYLLLSPAVVIGIIWGLGELCRLACKCCSKSTTPQSTTVDSHV